MSNPEDSDLEVEVAHVLLIDVVGYSKLLVDGQIEVLEQLNRVVRETAHFRSAEAKGKLMRLPTGDGMALLFFDSAETPLQCALEISRAARAYPLMQLRMGAHSGPIKEVMDVNNRPNFAGAGINIGAARARLAATRATSSSRNESPKTSGCIGNGICPCTTSGCAR